MRINMPRSEVKRYLSIAGMLPVDAGVAEGIFVSGADFDSLAEELQRLTSSKEKIVIAQRLRECVNNPRHVDPISDAFRNLIDEAINALSGVKV